MPEKNFGGYLMDSNHLGKWNFSKSLFAASFVILTILAVGIMVPYAEAEHTSVNKNLLDCGGCAPGSPPTDLTVNIRNVAWF